MRVVEKPANDCVKSANMKELMNANLSCQRSQCKFTRAHLFIVSTALKPSDHAGKS